MKHDIAFFEDEHKYLVDGQEVPSVTDILKPLHRSYGKVNSSVLDYAARRGTATHEALEQIDLGGEPDVVPEIVPYIRAYEEWKSIYRPTWTGVEQIVYSDFNGYIGTLDRVGVLNDRELAIVDLKTSQPTKEALTSVCVQTAAYEIAYCEDPKSIPLRKKYGASLRRYGLFLKSDGSFRFLDCEDYEKRYKFSGHKVFHSLLKTHKMVTEILATKEK